MVIRNLMVEDTIKYPVTNHNDSLLCREILWCEISGARGLGILGDLGIIIKK